MAVISIVNNPQNNSPIAATGATTITAFTLYPDQEDINNDNTMNTLEQYFEYKVNLTRDSFGYTGSKISSRTPSVSRRRPVPARLQTWYQFSIPLSEYYQNVGNMPDMRSMQFMRIYLNGLAGFGGLAVCADAAGAEHVEEFQLCHRYDG